MSHVFETVAEPGPEPSAGTPSPGFALQEIERRIDALIEECAQLREENQALRDRLSSLSAECARLVERSELVRSRVEAMIARLKAMERP